MAQKPNVSVSVDHLTGTAPLTVHFKTQAKAAQGEIKEYAWTFDDGTYSFAQNPAKTFPAPGVYDARLTVCDATGYNAASSLKITVNRAK